MVRPLNCIVAVSQNMGIGKNGNLPWPPLRNEFQYFQSMTTGSSVEGNVAFLSASSLRKVLPEEAYQCKFYLSEKLLMLVLDLLS